MPSPPGVCREESGGRAGCARSGGPPPGARAARGRHCSRALEREPGGRSAVGGEARAHPDGVPAKALRKQTLRRMEENSLTPEETEAIGLALMRLEETITDLAGRFGLSVDELNLDLGPLGRLR